MSIWQRFAVSLFTAVLLFGAQLRQWTDPRNRFLEQWETRDAWAILAGIAALAALGLLAREILARWPLPRRIANHLFIAALGGGLISTFLTYPDYKSELCYIALTALVVLSWCRPALRLPGRIARVALIFSPLALILGWQLVRYPTWWSPEEKPASPQAARDAQPVLLFVFDEWSWTRSTRNGELLPLFRNLRQFAKGAVDFTAARSPGPRTDVALPRIIYQTEDDLLITSREVFFVRDGARTATTAAPSLFSLARERGYSSSVLGFYMPYRRLLGAQADHALSINFNPKRPDFAGLAGDRLLSNVAFWHDPVSRKLADKLSQSVLPGSRERYSAHWEVMNRRLRSATLGLIAQSPMNSFSLIHFPAPHCPYVFNSDGTFRGPFRGSRKAHDAEGYERHLGYLDLLIGQFLGALRASGKFDRALIIITSDHSWRQDYEIAGKLQDGPAVRHVPLFIKLPGQREGRTVSSPFSLTSLRPLVEAVMRGESGEAALQSVLPPSPPQASAPAEVSL